MPPERTSSFDLSGLEDAFDWLKARKNALVGTLLVAALGFAVVSFVRRQAQESALEPWRPLFAATAPPWNAPAAELEAVSRGKVRDSDAEAYVAWWHALRLFENGNRAEALAELETFRSRFPTHPLCTAKLAASPPDEAETAIDRVVGSIRRLEAWNASHPTPTVNPPPVDGKSVTFTTSRGPIVVALHSAHSPKSCDAFLKVAASFGDHFIAKASPDRWVEIGHTEAGAPIETSAFTEGFPPFESNALSHFEGAVAFRQPPFSKPPFNADLRVLLKTDLNEDGRSTVFGQVVEGLEILRELSREERLSESPQRLAAPLKITEVKLP